MKLRKVVVSIIVLLIVIVALGGGYYLFDSNNEDYFFYDEIEVQHGFEVDNSFLKSVMIEGGESSISIRITNKEARDDFSVKINGLEGLAELEDKEFDIGNGDSYMVNINFKAINGTELGLHLGELEISSNTVRKIPIILEIQSRSVLFDSNLNVFPQGKDFNPGQTINSEIKIFDLASIGASNVELTYFVKDFSETLIVSGNEDLVVDDRLTINRAITFPDNLGFGSYVIGVVIKYDASVSTSSIFIKISEAEEEDRSDYTLLYISALFGLFLLLLLGLFIYSFFYRDKVLMDLQNDYRNELKNQREFINSRMRKDYSKLKTNEEKKVYKEEVEKVKKKRINVIKKVQKRRVVELKALKKKKVSKSVLKSQLSKWKAKGYDTKILDKCKVPSVDNIRKKVKQWKVKGYDTEVLDKNI